MKEFPKTWIDVFVDGGSFYVKNTSDNRTNLLPLIQGCTIHLESIHGDYIVVATSKIIGWSISTRERRKSVRLFDKYLEEEYEEDTEEREPWI